LILLDTNVVYWSMTGSRRLGPQALRLITDSPRRYVSSITHVELAIQQMRGKLRVPHDVADQLIEIGLDGLPYTDAHAQGLHEFPSLIGHDPFDRMLLAQAHVEGLTLVTSDRQLLAFDRTVDATR
jgi:PIN domain nuclease of toxin-antitoxin system